MVVEAVGNETNLAELASRPAEHAPSERESPSLLATILLAMMDVVVRSERGSPAAVEGTAAIDPTLHDVGSATSVHFGNG